jgi:hypothetical protein
MSWKDTSRTKNEPEDEGPTKAPDNVKPLFSSESAGHVVINDDLLNWKRHAYDTDPFTGKMDGLWAGHIWVAGGKPDPYLWLGLTQLKLEFVPEDNGALRGLAFTYVNHKQEVQGRRQTLNGIEEFDILLFFDLMPYSVRLIGKFNAEDETLVGSWFLHLEKDLARKAYTDHPFSFQPPRPDASPEENKASTNSSGNVRGPPKLKFIFRRTPAEVAGFWTLPEEGSRKDAKSRWEFVREAILHLVRRRLWSRSHILASTADHRKFIDLYRRDRLVAGQFSLPDPFTPADRETWHEVRLRLTPSHAHPCVAAFNWTFNRASFHLYVFS